MIRNVVATGFLIAVAALWFGAPAARADANPVCNPSCGTGQNCEFTDAAETQTACFAGTTGGPDCTAAGSNCVTEGLTVTATKKPATTGTTFANVVTNIVSLVNSAVIPLMYALAFLFFVYGIARYFIFESGEEAQEKGKKFLLYGLIGLVIIFSVWGIVNLFLTTLTSVTGTGS